MRKLTTGALSAVAMLCTGVTTAFAEPVEFKVLSDWGTGYNAQLKLTNETDKNMTDWRIAFDFDGDMSSLYSGKIISSKEGHYVLEGKSWNRTLKPGQSVVMGWSGKKGGVSRELANVDFSSTAIDVPTGPYLIGYDLQADWGSGYVASMSIENNDDNAMNGWQLSFDYPYDIGSIYNARIVSHEGDRYTIEGVDEGTDLSPNEVTVFVIRGSEGGLTQEPSNIQFSY
jgi:cellulase/cellobiase CelA1